jgi:hypothetical protein
LRTVDLALKGPNKTAQGAALGTPNADIIKYTRKP